MLCALKAHVSGPVSIVSDQGERIQSELSVLLAHDVKPLIHANTFVVVAREEDGVLVPLRKDELDRDSGGFAIVQTRCSNFVFDNDHEEFADDSAAQTCSNCLYRRLTSSGFSCVLDMDAIHAEEKSAS